MMTQHTHRRHVHHHQHAHAADQVIHEIGSRHLQRFSDAIGLDVPNLLRRSPPSGCDPDTDPACPQSSSTSSSSTSSGSGSGKCDPDTDPACPQGSSGSSASSDSSSAKSCNSVTDPSCGKGAGQSNITLPVVLGILIPLAAAVVVFIWLHRRHVKKLRREDAMDPHKSLDFGWDPNVPAAANKRKGRNVSPDMARDDLVGEKGQHRPRGLSMDMDMGSPYVLPPGLHGSRESLHSMSRTIHIADDRYRPATTFIPNDGTSTRSFPTRVGTGDHASSVDSGSSRKHILQDGPNQNLLRNAQRMSRSNPPLSSTPLNDSVAGKGLQENLPAPSKEAGLPPTTSAQNKESDMSPHDVALRKSNNYLGAVIHSRDPSTDVLKPEIVREASPPVLSQAQGNQSNSEVDKIVRPPRLQSLKVSTQPSHELNFFDEGSEYGDTFKVTPPSPTAESAPPPPPAKNSPIPVQESQVSSAEYHEDLYDPVSGIDFRRLSMGMRPLPPEDPSDNPEQRANRIRSFYKEYFDDSKPGPGHDPRRYYEDYDEGYLDNGTIFDPESGQFVTAQRPYAQPVGRRAMTPPPRNPPRFQGPGNRLPRHHATMSGGLTPPAPRAFSSASGRFGPPHGAQPRKVLPPPGPLQVLPSPHLLREDSFALPIDFAPPSTYKDRVAGRPESPRGGQRPFSPAAPIAMPLVSSFDDLSVMPSPHALRKSGTFTALDFAPPPRFGHSTTASDAGSIRSNHSAMSGRQLHNIRAGAYRLSRIPKESVGTKTDINEALRPQWNMHK